MAGRTAHDAITAARFSITVDGYEIASFSELQGISTEIETVEFIESGDKGLDPDEHCPAKPVPPTIVLKRGKTTAIGDVGVARGGPLRRDRRRPQELLARDVRRRRQAGRPLPPRERLAVARSSSARCKAGSSRGADGDGHDRLRAPPAGRAREHADARPRAPHRRAGACVARTEFPFVLPRGYVDERGQVHREGVMRLATAGDEIWPQTDPRVRENPAYLTVLLLDRTVTQLGLAARGRHLRDREPVRLRPRVPAGPVPADQPGRPHRRVGHLPALRARIRGRHRGDAPGGS